MTRHDERDRLRRQAGTPAPWLVVAVVVVVLGALGAGVVGVGVMAWLTRA